MCNGLHHKAHLSSLGNDQMVGRELALGVQTLQDVPDLMDILESFEIKGRFPVDHLLTAREEARLV